MVATIFVIPNMSDSNMLYVVVMLGLVLLMLFLIYLGGGYNSSEADR